MIQATEAKNLKAIRCEERKKDLEREKKEKAEAFRKDREDFQAEFRASIPKRIAQAEDEIKLAAASGKSSIFIEFTKIDPHTLWRRYGSGSSHSYEKVLVEELLPCYQEFLQPFIDAGYKVSATTDHVQGQYVGISFHIFWG